jgi:hypothetical protein
MTGANLFFVSVHYYCGGSATVSVSDNATSPSNSYTLISATSPGTAGLCESDYYVSAPHAISSQTFTVSGTSSYSSMSIIGFSGVAASYPLDSGAVSSARSQSSIIGLAVGPVTPVSNNEVVVVGCVLGNGSATGTIGSPFSSVGRVSYLNNNNEGGVIGYLIQTTATSENPTCSFGGSVTGGAVVIAAFKSS